MCKLHLAKSKSALEITKGRLLPKEQPSFCYWNLFNWLAEAVE